MEQDLRSRLRMLSMGLGLSVMALCAAWALLGIADLAVVWLVVVGGLGCGVVLFLGDRAAVVVARDVAGRVGRELGRRQRAQDRLFHESFQRLESVVTAGRKDLVRVVEQIERGESPSIPRLDPAAGRSGHPVAVFEHALLQAQIDAMEIVGQAAAGCRQRQVPEAEAEAFVYIAQRLHALVSQTLTHVSAMENRVEEPELLDAVFKLDNLVTRTRRAVESIAVLGGETARRVRQPILLGKALRQAIAEVEQFARVQLHIARQQVVFPERTRAQVVPLTDVSLPGYAGPDIIHLLAVLVENATVFSPPETTVWLRAEEVPAGLALEVEDRGLSMSPVKLARLNQLLAAPEHGDLRRQVRDGQIGLLVTARLAKRHGVQVTLRQNPGGGIRASVVVPRTLLVAPPQTAQPQAGGRAPTAAAIATGPVAAGAGPTETLGTAPALPAREQHQRASDSGKPAAPPLPQRRKRTVEAPAAGPSTDGAAISPDASPGERPPLPRRRGAPGIPDPVAAPRRAGPASSPTPGLMARYSAGVRSGAKNAPAEVPRAPGPAG